MRENVDVLPRSQLLTCPFHLQALLKETEKLLDTWKHPDPYCHPTAPGGTENIHQNSRAACSDQRLIDFLHRIQVREEPSCSSSGPYVPPCSFFECRSIFVLTAGQLLPHSNSRHGNGIGVVWLYIEVDRSRLGGRSFLPKKTSFKIHILDALVSYVHTDVKWAPLVAA